MLIASEATETGITGVGMRRVVEGTNSCGPGIGNGDGTTIAASAGVGEGEGEGDGEGEGISVGLGVGHEGALGQGVPAGSAAATSVTGSAGRSVTAAEGEPVNAEARADLVERFASRCRLAMQATTTASRSKVPSAWTPTAARLALGEWGAGF
jgi:hypothetical protein